MDKALDLLDTILDKILPKWPINWPTAMLLWFFVLVVSSLAGGVTLLLLPAAPEPLLAGIVAGVVTWFTLWHDEGKWTRFLSAFGANVLCYGWGLFFGNHTFFITSLWVDSSLIMALGVILMFTSPSKLADEIE